MILVKMRKRTLKKKTREELALLLKTPCCN